jgi:adenosylmethionine-8-amino-7-oxononanoate aminotransferase
MPDFAKLDQKYLWHPFTQMRDWLKRKPIVIASGRGAVLRDTQGREYLDANSSIWTNLHGHNHLKINAAINKQLKKIAHSSALGLANEPTSLLAERLVKAAILQKSAPSFGRQPAMQPQSAQARKYFLPLLGERAGVRAGVPLISPAPVKGRGEFKNPKLEKVFFSDDGSTAMEVALKLAYSYARRTGCSKNPRFLSLQGAYHGDTLGAVALGHIDLFHKAYNGLLFKTDRVMAPYCYRCPFNRAKPERADAREYRKCNWECVGQVEKTFTTQKKRGNPYAAFVFEPLMQGAAGMIPQPEGWLRRVTAIARDHGAQLIADEVMTGFGRTGFPLGVSDPADNNTSANLDNKRRKFLPLLGERAGVRAGIPLTSIFACHHEGVQPDFLALAKGLTGGYLPMAATLTTQSVFDVFLGDYSEFKTFFHGHSFTGNQLGAAAAIASLDLLQNPASIRARLALQKTLHQQLQTLWSLPNVGDIRQVGLVAGIELVKDWRTRKPFALREQAGIRVCEAMARRGVLTRPIGNVIVLMPPYCTTPQEVAKMVHALKASIQETLLPS